MANYKILIVEDEAPIRRNICEKIRRMETCFEISDAVKNGQMALDSIKKEIPHVVFTDIRMPVMDGLNLAKHLYYTHPALKIVIISGYNDFDYAREALNYEVKAYLMKPVKKEELKLLLVKLKSLLDIENRQLLDMANTFAPGTAPKKIIEQIQIYLRNNFRDNISLQNIAEKMKLSIDSLSRIFKKHIGITPIQYLIQLRINEARRLLSVDEDIEISTIGEMVGYSDPYYFSRIFKKNVNMTPSEYRSNHCSRGN